ncbi:unnamed protein product [Lasius platythorax]|uniref:Uncharacterized protein n=1 Tax=Lasius platythorax TaxID=488582 RepID=A0AAV2MYP0_9HYME
MGSAEGSSPDSWLLRPATKPRWLIRHASVTADGQGQRITRESRAGENHGQAADTRVGTPTYDNSTDNAPAASDDPPYQLITPGRQPYPPTSEEPQRQQQPAQSVTMRAVVL